MMIISIRVATGSWMQCNELASHSSWTRGRVGMVIAGTEQLYSRVGVCQWTYLVWEVMTICAKGFVSWL